VRVLEDDDAGEEMDDENMGGSDREDAVAAVEDAAQEAAQERDEHARTVASRDAHLARAHAAQRRGAPTLKAGMWIKWLPPTSQKPSWTERPDLASPPARRRWRWRLCHHRRVAHRAYVIGLGPRS